MSTTAFHVDDEGTRMNADLILYNGHFHTVDRDLPIASAVAIQGGRFVAVGDEARADRKSHV